MPTKSHHRSRSSVDRVFDLLADLQDNQIALLLDDLNHTTASNVPVSQAIALFDPGKPKPKPRREFGRSSSPMRTLQAELERRNSKRISSAPEPSYRPKTASPSSTQQQPASPSIPELPPLERSSARPSLTLSPPTNTITRDDRPKTAVSQRSESRGPRGYKRISRPLFLSPTATAELHELLLAYLSDDTPSSATTTATPSPVTPPRASPRFGMFSPFSTRELENDSSPGLDLLEPTPTRLPPHFALGKTVTEPTDNMSSIFEVLAL
ncbi:hypothetical protein B0H66DRAFT_144732 [Apodospora peruviana]|uniref:Uncharacterized protein n=1 Tax=Apodospora peruviana TaxID=516989 RepID=A0AAE0IJ89_9PEZI|nr:hypothetical protein B0H66DRAFT_144732 [Apodospora peruviana]